MPFKLNQDRRHHIPRQQRKVTNWPAYDASLRQRGSLTVWFTEEAVEAWAAEPRTTRGGQPWYSPLAILTALTLRAVFRLAFRQTEGLIGSIMRLLGLDAAGAGPHHAEPSGGDAGSAAARGRGGGGPLHLLVEGPASDLRIRPSRVRARSSRVARAHVARPVGSGMSSARRNARPMPFRMPPCFTSQARGDSAQRGPGSQPGMRRRSSSSPTGSVSPRGAAAGPPREVNAERHHREERACVSDTIGTMLL